MCVTQAEVAARFAASQGARATWFVPARNTCDLIAKLCLIGLHDRLVVCANDFASSFRAQFPFGNLSFAAEPTPMAMLAASVADPSAEVARLVPEGSPASYAHPAGINADRLFWFVASEGGLGLRVAHIRALAEAAATVGAILIVDNTIPSLYGCNPISLGAHVSLEALDRVAAGKLAHKVVSVSVARSVNGRGRRRLVSPKSEEVYRLLAFSLGDPERPSDAFSLAASDLAAIEEGVASLPERMQSHIDHAHAIAAYLACHERVGHVFYPGLPAHPDHALAPNVLLHGTGPAIDFALRGDDAETMETQHRAFLAACPCAHRDALAGGSLTRMGLVADQGLCYIRLFAGLDDPLAVVDALDATLSQRDMARA